MYDNSKQRIHFPGALLRTGWKLELKSETWACTFFIQNPDCHLTDWNTNVRAFPIAWPLCSHPETLHRLVTYFFCPNPLFLICKDPLKMPISFWVFPYFPASLDCFYFLKPWTRIQHSCHSILHYSLLFISSFLLGCKFLKTREHFHFISLPCCFLENRVWLRVGTLSLTSIRQPSQKQCSDNPFLGWTMFMKKINKGENTPLTQSQGGHSLPRTLGVFKRQTW